MLAVARARLAELDLAKFQVRQGDIHNLPVREESVDLITVHQVLHYLSAPAVALAESARVLKKGGRLLIVDFAPHELEFLREEHAHQRLGIADHVMQNWLKQNGLKLEREQSLPSPDLGDGKQGLSVSLWLATKS